MARLLSSLYEREERDILRVPAREPVPLTVDDDNVWFRVRGYEAVRYASLDEALRAAQRLARGRT